MAEPDGLLPHYRDVLRSVRVRDLNLSYRAMADALSETQWRPLLVAPRNKGGRVDHTTVRAVEVAQEGWPRNPDAWMAAYAELAGVTPVELWTRALAAWTRATSAPDAAALVARLGEELLDQEGRQPLPHDP